MLITRLLSAETALPEEETLGGAIKKFFLELLYGGSDAKYENFSFGNQVVTYRMIILAIALGLIIASAVVIYKRRVLGKLVRALWKEEAVGAEKAKTLSELSLDSSRAILSSLRRGSLRRMLPSVLKDKHDEEMRLAIESEKEAKEKKKSGEKREKTYFGDFKPDPLKDSYYLPEDEGKREDLLRLFSEKGSGAVGFILTVIFCIAAAALLFYAVPFFLGLFDSAL